MKISKKPSIQAELLGLLTKNPSLRAEDLVSFVEKNPKSAIRKAFDDAGLFDDAHAARLARLAFARAIIQRVKVKMIAADNQPINVRAIINLTDSRYEPQGGYMTRAKALKSSTGKRALANDLSRDIETLIRKYPELLNADDITTLRSIPASLFQ